MTTDRRPAPADPQEEQISDPDLVAAIAQTRSGLEGGLQALAGWVRQALAPDGVPRAQSLSQAAACFRGLCAVADLLAAGGTKPDEKLLATVRSGLVRMLDAFLGLVAPGGQLPAFGDGGSGGCPELLAEGAGRFQQGEYAWPVAMLGHSLPDSAGVPLPPPFTSVNLPDSRFAALRSDWTPRAHYLAVNYGPPSGPSFELHAFGETMATRRGTGVAGDEAAVWTTGLFLDALGAGYQEQEQGTPHRQNLLFVKPVGDLPGYWLVTDSGLCLSWRLESPLPLAGNGGLVTATAGPGRPGLQVIPARPMELRLGHGAGAGETNWLAFDGSGEACRTSEIAILLAPYERVAPAPGSFQIQPFTCPGGPGRCYRVMHHLGYDLLVVGDGTLAQFDEAELTTDAHFALIRVRGGVVVARQASRCSQVRFRGEELAQ
jgi:hypothetical protein